MLYNHKLGEDITTLGHTVSHRNLIPEPNVILSRLWLHTRLSCLLINVFVIQWTFYGLVQSFFVFIVVRRDTCDFRASLV